MKVLIAWDGDHIGREVGRASLADDVEGLRRISQAIDLGNNTWRSWIVMNGGSVISMGGDEGRAEILAEKLPELPKIREQYAEAVGASVSVGVGTKLSEADRALIVAKLRGGNRIVLYTDDLEDEIKAAEQEKETTTEADKLTDEYLGKADPSEAPAAPESPGAAQPTAAGFQGAQPQVSPGNDQPQGSPDPAQDAGAAQEQGAQPQASTGDAGADFESAFHDLATQQQSDDQGQAQQGGTPEQLKAQVVQILQSLKQQAPILEQIKQTAPDTYQAVMNMAQAVIAMAKEMNGDPQHTSAKELGDRANSDAQVQVPLPPEDGEGSSSKDKKSDTKKSLAKAEKAGKHDCEEFGHCWGTGAAKGHCLLCGEHESELEKAGRSWSVPPGLQKAAQLSDRFGDWYEQKHGEYVPDCQHAATVVGCALHRLGHKVKVIGGTALGDDDAGEPGQHYWLNVDGKDFDPKSHIVKVPYSDYSPEFEWHPDEALRNSAEDPDEPLAHLLGVKKASLSPNAGAPAAHHHLQLPVGSKIDPTSAGTARAGRIKVTHTETGKQGWIQARAGQVLSQDGHAISARNPNGK
jgi:hypothetical protein